MNAEELKQLGITDEEMIKKIIISHGKDIESHKAKLAEAETKRAALEEQAKQAAEQLKKFQDMKPEELQKSVADLQAKYEQAQAEAQAKVDKLKYDTAIENALRDAKAKSLKAARAVLDEAELKLGEDGTIAGLEDRVKKAAAENAFLFGNDTPPKVIPKVVAKTTTPPPTPDDPVIAQLRKGAGLPPVKIK